MFSVQYSVFQHIGLMHEQYQFCPWCYEDMSMVLLLSSVVLPLVNGVTSCKLFHKKDK